jgi:hypothetical protein
VSIRLQPNPCRLNLLGSATRGSPSFASLLVEDERLAALLRKNFPKLGTLASFPDTLFKSMRPAERENHYTVGQGAHGR